MSRSARPPYTYPTNPVGSYSIPSYKRKIPKPSLPIVSPRVLASQSLHDHSCHYNRRLRAPSARKRANTAQERFTVDRFCHAGADVYVDAGRRRRGAIVVSGRSGPPHIKKLTSSWVPFEIDFFLQYRNHNWVFNQPKFRRYLNTDH